MAVHSTQLDSQALQRPVVVEPNCPLGQKVVQLPTVSPTKNGAPEVGGHAVHAIASIGELHEAQAWSQGLQKPVAFAANPEGHVARH
jgi:hypothetical protein